MAGRKGWVRAVSSLGDPYQRYSHDVMPTKLTLILLPSPLHPPEPVGTMQSRVIFCVGGDRFAIDFTSTVTELSPQPAEVIPIQKRRRAKRRSRASGRRIELDS